MNHEPSAKIRIQFAKWPALVVVLVSISDGVLAQASGDPMYQTRLSQCHHEPPPGAALSVSRTDSGIIKRGYTAEQVLTQSADARRAKGGNLLVCTEYG